MERINGKLEIVDQVAHEKTCFQCKFLQTEYFDSSCGGYAKYYCLHPEHPKYLGTSIYNVCDDKKIKEDI